MLSKDNARRIAANIAKLPELEPRRKQRLISLTYQYFGFKETADVTNKDDCSP